MKLLFLLLPLVSNALSLPYFDIQTGLKLEGNCHEDTVYLKNNTQVGYLCKNGQMVYNGCYPLRHNSIHKTENETWYDNMHEGTMYQCKDEQFVVTGCMHEGEFYHLVQFVNESGIQLEARKVWDSEVCKYKCSLLPPDNDSLCEPPKINPNETIFKDTVEEFPTPIELTTPPPIEATPLFPKPRPQPDFPEPQALELPENEEITPPADMNIDGADLVHTGGGEEPFLAPSVPITPSSMSEPEDRFSARGGQFEEFDYGYEEESNPKGRQRPQHVYHNRSLTTEIITKKVIENINELENWTEPKKVEGLNEKRFSQRYRRKCVKKYWKNYNRKTKQFCAKEYEDKFQGCSLLAPVCKTSILRAYEIEAQQYPYYAQFTSAFRNLLSMRNVKQMSTAMVDFYSALSTLADVHFESPILYGAVERFVNIYDTRFVNMQVEHVNTTCVELINRCSNRDVASCHQLQRETECHNTEIAPNDCCNGCHDRNELIVELVHFLCPETCMVRTFPQNARANFHLAFDMQSTFTCPFPRFL